eukprot:COSAG06_NODE_5274_length_3593_cov_25.942187_7_plen_78_part_00
MSTKQRHTEKPHAFNKRMHCAMFRLTARSVYQDRLGTSADMSDKMIHLVEVAGEAIQQPAGRVGHKESLREENGVRC